MKFSLSWLKHHLDTKASLTEICEKLTSLGLEVESVVDHGKKLAPFIIAHVIDAVQHPNADRLRVCTVDTGSEKLQVVCGASNARAGIKVVLARPGDIMPDTGEVLKKGVIRSIESQGMLCAVDELGIGDEHEGIIELPLDAPVGTSFASYGGYDDPVIEINLTPNRPDCTGVRGIARDLAAAGLGVLKVLDTSPVVGAEESRIKIILDLPDNNKACPLFVGRLIRNIKNGPSPEWLQRRLRAIGLRPISALVDITNYLTFDCSRPLHVFDAKKINGNLWVKPAKGGETFQALNGKAYTLKEGMTAIGDDTGVLSLAGIMGGANSGCDENTTDVFFEAALFDPVRTALSARALQITSDARYRFERGVDPFFTLPGAELATKLILELCATPETVVSKIEMAGTVPGPAPSIVLDLAKCHKLSGIDATPDEQESILTSLGFLVTRTGQTFSVVPPGWRPDIAGAADLVEEIIRIKGYDHLPVTSLDRPTAVTHAAIDIDDARAYAARRALASSGLMEAITWSFMSKSMANIFSDVSDSMHLSNPISSDLDVMRPSVLGNLIQAAKRNADRGFMDAGLFEIGPIFKNTTPEGQVSVVSVLRGGHTPRHWAAPSRSVDAYDVKADATAALLAAGAPVSSLQITNDAPLWYHPGRSGVLRLGPTVLAYFGELHPSVLAACDVAGPMVASEIFLGNIPAARSAGTARSPLKLETLQSISRDFAFVLDRAITAAKLIKAVRDADKNLIRDVNLFDVYEGEKVAPDKKSIAISVTIQPTEKSLTETEIEAIAAKVTASVAKATGAVLRT